jgi:excisionase family DNA binding protein
MNETSTATPRFLTICEAASILRISRGSAYEAARQGKLPTIRIGRSLRVPPGFEKILSGDHEPEQAQPADRRGGNRAMPSRGRFSPVTGREKVCSRQLPKVIT